MSNNEKKIDLIYGELLNRCWKDEKYLERFRKEPAEVLAEAGIPVKAGVNYHVVDQTKYKFFHILPKRSSEEEPEKLEDIKAEIKAKTGIGEDAEIEILQNTDTDVYLPYYPAPKFKPLADDELLAVAGGGWFDPPAPVGSLTMSIGPGPGPDPDPDPDPPVDPGSLYLDTATAVETVDQVVLYTEVGIILVSLIVG